MTIPLLTSRPVLTLRGGQHVKPINHFRPLLVLKGDNWCVSDSTKNFKSGFFPDAVKRGLCNFAWISACLGSSYSHHGWWHSPCFNSQVFDKALINTAKTYEQSSAPVDPCELPTGVTDEQSDGAIVPLVLPVTETEENSQRTLIQRVLSTVKVRFMFWAWTVFEN